MNSSETQGLLRLSQAARAAGVTRQTLQYYLMIGLVEPAQYGRGGHRLFDEKSVERVKLVKKLNDSGYPLREIREIFLKHKS